MQLRITSSVGKDGKNIANDVKIIRALLNVYMRQQSSAGKLKIEARSNNELEEAIFSFQKYYLKVSKPDSRVDPNGRSFRGLKQVLFSVFKPLGVSEPSFGVVTWNSEGAEGGPYHSGRNRQREGEATGSPRSHNGGDPGYKDPCDFVLTCTNSVPASWAHRWL